MERNVVAMKLIGFFFALAFCGLASIGSPCAAAPILDGERNYTLVFAEDGEISKGDIKEDGSAVMIGRAQTVVSTGQSGLQVLQGAALIKTEKSPIKLAFGNDLDGTLSPHSKLIVARRGGHFDLLSMQGQAIISIRNQDQVVEPNQPMTLSSENSVGLSPGNSKMELDFINRKNKEEPVRLLASPGTQFSVKDDSFKIMSGTAFVQLPARVSLVTPGGTLHCEKPYMVSYRMVDDCLCVENCTPCDSIKFDVRGDEIKLQPFSGCILKHCDAQSATVPEDGILRRNLLVKSDGVFSVMVAEYDPMSLLESHSELKRTLKNPVTAHDRMISELVFKGVAVFQELCGNIETYQAALKPESVQMLGYFKNPLKFAAKYEILK
jgi:hypothetical protein